MLPTIFSAGDKVEVKGSTSWHPATVFCSNQNSDDSLMIEYNTLRTNTVSHDCCVYSVSVSVVRPQPPLNRPEFRIGECIEVFQDNRGWRSGKLLGFCAAESRCTVLIDGEEKTENINCHDLRPCLHWIDGSWTLHSPDQNTTSEPEIRTNKKKLKIKFSKIPLQTKFSVGSKVEVRSDEVGYEGAWYTATILGSIQQNKFLIEYHTLKTADFRHPLQEVAKEQDIRPYPPEIPKIIRYRKRQAVDAWHNEGWWEGVISKVIDDLTYTVYFAPSNEKLKYEHACLRPHQDWINGNWVTPLRMRSSSKLAANFSKGEAVEVRSNESGLLGSWFSAIIVEPKGKSKFLIEYKTLRTDDESEFLKELVDVKDIRPYPPQMIIDSYEQSQKVDVWYNDGWWEGAVCQVLGDSMYRVYFSSDEEMEFDIQYYLPKTNIVGIAVGNEILGGRYSYLY